MNTPTLKIGRKVEDPFIPMEEAMRKENRCGLLVRSSHDTGTEVELREINRKNLEVEFIISSFRRDDFGTRFDPHGVDLTQYRKNPIVLYRHMRDDGIFTLPIARGVVSTFRIDRDGRMHMIARFTPEETFDFGFQVYKLVRDGFLNMASIGAQVMAEEIVEEDDGRKTLVFTKWKLMEFSVVPIGANDDALVVDRELSSITDEEINRANTTVLDEDFERGVTPPNPTKAFAPDSTPWSKPLLKDFTSKPWDELADNEKRRIARHFAWAAALPPENFTDLKLPHHRAEDGKVVLRALRAATARLSQADLPEADVAAVKRHLRKHFTDGGFDVPESLREADTSGDVKLEIESITDMVARVHAEYVDENGNRIHVYENRRIDVGETDEQRKHREYFEEGQPLMKLYRRAMEKFYKRMGLVPPKDEISAVKQMISMILPSTESPKSDSATLKDRGTHDPTPKADGTRQPTVDELRNVSTELVEYVTKRKREALRSGIPVKKVEQMYDKWVDEGMEILSQSPNSNHGSD